MQASNLTTKPSKSSISPRLVREKSIFSVEQLMHVIFVCCGFIAVVAVVIISLYMVISGFPIIAQVGLKGFLFGVVWNPLNNTFGILPLILSSVIATAFATLVGGVLGVTVAVFLAFIAGPKTTAVFRFLIELLAGIPSVVYGLLGAILIVPLIFQIQTVVDLPTSGSLIAAIIVLIIMILPTIISVAENALKSVPDEYLSGSYALGASKIQSIVRVMIPSAKSGITSGLVLGVGRALGETMAVMMVAGNASIMPELLRPARLLTVGISIEWAYSSGLHRQGLQGIGLVLFLFIMITNIVLNTILKRGGSTNAR